MRPPEEELVPAQTGSTEGTSVAAAAAGTASAPAANRNGRFSEDGNRDSASPTGLVSDDDDDGGEPVLKYQRMGSDVAKLLLLEEEKEEREVIVRVAVHDSCLVSSSVGVLYQSVQNWLYCTVPSADRLYRL